MRHLTNFIENSLSALLWLCALGPLALLLFVAGVASLRHDQPSLPGPQDQTPRRSGASSYLTWPLVCLMSLSSLWLLSGCGTVPSPVAMRRPVPAVLLVPPREPIPLVPKVQGSPSETPGSTTPPTPRPVPKTGSGIDT